jgi:hypothetical protein
MEFSGRGRLSFPSSFAALLKNALFVILNEVKDPA